MKNSATLKYLPDFISKMEKEKLPRVVIDTFAYYYKKVVAGERGLLFNKDISCVFSTQIEDAKNINEYADAGRKAFKHSVRIVLNGGLGTTMGLEKPKSLLRVKNGKTFIEIILKQVERSDVKLLFMNSFSTHKETYAALKRINPSRFPMLFLQHKFPKILCDGFVPATWSKNPELEWNPPGHGDVYTALYTSGMLQGLIDEGITYAFISNSDNLGATMDKSLLGYFSENKFPFMMEVAERTPVDLKGGHLARYKNSRLILREAAQCPEDELNIFRDIDCYGFFNTNNIWINLKFLKNIIEKYGIVRLPMILNSKTLDPRNESSPSVYQIETAMGAAISIFEEATVIKVPRSRFFPVKNCNDLMVVRSDRFVLTKEKGLISNPDRKMGAINIKLDPEYYAKIDFFNKRFINGIPSLIDCESLSVEGDVLFEKNVTIKGKVLIKNTGKFQAVIKEGSVIESDVIL